MPRISVKFYLKLPNTQEWVRHTRDFDYVLYPDRYTVNVVVRPASYGRKPYYDYSSVSVQMEHPEKKHVLRSIRTMLQHPIISKFISIPHKQPGYRIEAGVLNPKITYTLEKVTTIPVGLQIKIPYARGCWKEFTVNPE